MFVRELRERINRPNLAQEPRLIEVRCEGTPCALVILFSLHALFFCSRDLDRASDVPNVAKHTR